jgi:glycerate 2-kinase
VTTPTIRISGGGSSLMPMPAEGVKLRDKAATTEMLMKAGADIRELNCVRKHLSAIKGGRLAERLFPATVLTLVVSDVVGDDIGFVASGPTVPDATTYRMARSVLVRRSLWGSVPKL